MMSSRTLKRGRRAPALLASLLTLTALLPLRSEAALALFEALGCEADHAAPAHVHVARGDHDHDAHLHARHSAHDTEHHSAHHTEHHSAHHTEHHSAHAEEHHYGAEAPTEHEVTAVGEEHRCCPEHDAFDHHWVDGSHEHTELGIDFEHLRPTRDLELRSPVRVLSAVLGRDAADAAAVRRSGYRLARAPPTPSYRVVDTMVLLI